MPSKAHLHGLLQYSHTLPTYECYCSADQKDRMEAENQSMVLTFGSHLDQRLKDLHRTVLGSVSQQQQYLRCMEEHVCSYLASKCDVRKDTFYLIFFLALFQLVLWFIISVAITRQHRLLNQGLRE